MANFFRNSLDKLPNLCYCITKMNDTKKQLKPYTITMKSGTRFGGKFYNEEQVLKAYKHCLDKILIIEQRSLFTSEESEEIDREKMQWRSR